MLYLIHVDDYFYHNAWRQKLHIYKKSICCTVWSFEQIFTIWSEYLILVEDSEIFTELCQYKLCIPRCQCAVVVRSRCPQTAGRYLECTFGAGCFITSWCLTWHVWGTRCLHYTKIYQRKGNTKVYCFVLS